MIANNFFDGIEQEILDSITIRSASAYDIINENLKLPISKRTYLTNVKKVTKYVESGRVPTEFLNIKAPPKNARVMSFPYFCLLFNYIVYIDSLRVADAIPMERCLPEIKKEAKYWFSVEKITRILNDHTVKQYDDQGKPLYEGKMFDFYFKVEGIKCHINSFRVWSEKHPELPYFSRRKLYTSEEFDQWRKFLKSKPGRIPPQKQHDQPTKKVAIEIC
jgi:hypothetical protein